MEKEEGGNRNDRELIVKRGKQTSNDQLPKYYMRMWTKCLGDCGKAAPVEERTQEKQRVGRVGCEKRHFLVDSYVFLLQTEVYPNAFQAPLLCCLTFYKQLCLFYFLTDALLQNMAHLKFLQVNHCVSCLSIMMFLF